MGGGEKGGPENTRGGKFTGVTSVRLGLLLGLSTSRNL